MISLAAELAGLRRIVGGFALLLIASTWPLWWEPASIGNPQIPCFSWLCGWPFWVDRVAVGILLTGLVMMLCGPTRSRVWQLLPLGLSLTGFCTLLALDQHRIQPWAWQFVLYDILFLLAWNGSGIRYWRWIICGIYFYSALSKFDAAFLTSHGQLLLQGMLEPLGLPVAFWSPGMRTCGALLLPLGELLVALLLLLPNSRQLGLGTSVGMHLLLVWTLGTSLSHEWGVIVWNLYFVMQNIWVFGMFTDAKCTERLSLPVSPNRRLNAACIFTGFALSYPALEFVGLCDHWPAWAVYCSRPAQLRVLIAAEAATNLSPELQDLLGPPAPLEDRLPLRLERWAFQQRHCPLYPQLRYRLALAHSLLAESIEDDAVTFEIAQTPNRWTGARNHLALFGLQAAGRYEERYFLNSQPRRH